MKTFNVKLLTTSGVLAAMVFLLTYMIRIPAPASGYIHLGDSLVFFTSLVLGPVFGFLSAGIGGLLADLFSGFAIYAIATFFIKGSMSVIVYFLYKSLSKKFPKKTAKFRNILIASFFASCFMVGGYFLYDIFLLGLGGALANVLFNVIQGIASTLFSVVLVLPFEAVISFTNSSNE